MNWLSILTGPITNIIQTRQQRKAAKEAARAKLVAARQENQQTLELNKDEYEAVATAGLVHTWKDEYATVSVISILNLVVVGGLAAAFGHRQILEGVVLAIQALTEIGVDVGFLLNAAVLSALGLSVWKRI